MKKSKIISIITFSAIILFPFFSHGQLLNKLKQKADQELNKQADKALNPKKETPPPAKDKAPNATTSKDTEATEKKSLVAYQNYDFVPGEQIVFEDSFTDDEMGEFPAHWSLVSGQGTLNMVEGKKAFLLTEYSTRVNPLVKQPLYLSDPFTIEFDHFIEKGYGLSLYFYNSDKDVKGNDLEIGYIDLCSLNGWTTMTAGVKGEPTMTASIPEPISGEKYYNKWHHIAIVYKGKRLKFYIDQYRVMALPDFAVTPKSFAIIGRYAAPDSPMAIANVRVANGGGMKTTDKKFTDAKIVTHINFDVDKSSIKPESMGTLNAIVEILKNNPDLKFEIQGHTDNTGDAAHNLTLSQQRADAVKEQLISMGIDEDRLESKGLGDIKPMTDNATLEGRANNRRVEFVKL
jgi:OmpA-OmpF porin, OOP family